MSVNFGESSEKKKVHGYDYVMHFDLRGKKTTDNFGQRENTPFYIIGLISPLFSCT